MQGPQNLCFTPNPNIPYKIISVLDYQKAFTLQDKTHKLTIADYSAAPNQLFKIFQNNNKYAFVNPNVDGALCVENQNKADGGVVKSDPGQHQSSFFQIVPVTKGDWAGKACHINTFAEGRSLDIKGGKPNPNTQICQWKFHGNANQQWLVIPADNLQPGQQGQQGGNQLGVEEQKFDEPDVPAVFEVKPNASYKVVSVLDDEKCLTLNKDNKLTVSTFKKQPSQKFAIHKDKDNKLAFVCAQNNSGLCIFQDKEDNGAQIISDGGQHPSSWFTLSRADKGKWACKAYLIKTHAKLAFDIQGGKAEDGKFILQYKVHQGQNQLWLVEPFEEEQGKKKKGGKGKKGGKKAPKEVHYQDVQPKFISNTDRLYKICSLSHKNMVISVNKENKVVISRHHGKQEQHFHLYPDNNKFGIVDKKSNSGLCIFQDKPDNAAPIITDSGKHTSSWFQIERIENGPFAHKAYHIKTHAGKCLDVAGGKIEEGAGVIQANLAENINQLWTIELCKGANKPKGKFNNWKNQLEYVHQIVPEANYGSNQGMGFLEQAKLKPNQNYIFYAVHGDGIKALDIAQDAANNGQLIMFSFHGAPNQRFVFEQEGNMYRIKNVKEGKYLNVANDDPHDGMLVRCDEKGKFASQLWTIIPANDPKFAGKNAFHLRSIYGKALESPGSTLDNNAKIQQGTFQCSEGQTWIIKEI